VAADGVANWYTGADEYFGYDAGGRFPGTDYGLTTPTSASLAMSTGTAAATSRTSRIPAIAG
jgi:hypothetical protein